MFPFLAFCTLLCIAFARNNNRYGAPSNLLNLTTSVELNRVCKFIDVCNMSQIYVEWTCSDGIVNSDPCSWRGLSCAIINDSYRIDSVTLHNTRLACPLWRFFPYSFPSISYVDFSYNSITGSIPPNIFKLTRLSYINLANNRLNSTIPSSIGLVRSLTVLSLYMNSLSSAIPHSISLLTKLFALYLDKNSFTSSIPSSIGQLISLNSLRLDSNKFDSSLPASLGSISNLRYFSAFGNRLTSSIPTSLGYLSKVVFLGLHQNSLISSIPLSLRNLSSLKVISLYDNQLTDPNADSICSARSLSGVLLFGNPNLQCIPRCEVNPGAWNAPSQVAIRGVVSRCQDDQDTAVGQFDASLQVSQVLGQQINTQAAYIASVNQTYQFIHDPNVIQYSFSLDIVNSHMGLACLLYYICTDRTCKTILWTYDGNSKDPRKWVPYATIPGSQFYFTCPECHLCPGWKYAFTVTAYSHLVSNWAFTASPQGRVATVSQQDFATPSIESHSEVMISTAPASSSTTGSLRAASPVGIGAAAELRDLWYSSVSTNWSMARYAPTLCVSNWKGIGCTYGVVTSINLNGAGLHGTIPSAIGLLTGLTSLDLSSNAITGTLPTSLALLVNLKRLTLTNNLLKGAIPDEMAALSSLVVADLGFNRFSQSVPTLFTASTTLAELFLDGNLFSGEVSAVLCEAAKSRNITVTLTNCQDITCYQRDCQELIRSNQVHFDPSLIMCAPTPSPTRAPTSSPSPYPTVSTVGKNTPGNDNNKSYVVVGIALGVVAAVALCSLILYVRHRWRAEEEVQRRKRAQRLKQLPVHAALLALKEAVQAHPDRRHASRICELIDRNEDKLRERDFEGRTVVDIALQEFSVLAAMSESMSEDILQIMVKLIDLLLPLDPVTSEEVSPEAHLHAWTTLVQHEENFCVATVGAILGKYSEIAKDLTAVEDEQGRCCLHIAGHRCKAEMIKVLYLFGRYELAAGPPEYRSATSVVVLATDHGSLGSTGDTPIRRLSGQAAEDTSDPEAKVALKFMRHRDQYYREVEVRGFCEFDERFVLPLLKHYDGHGFELHELHFRDDAKGKGFEQYPFCVVMEAATCSLKRVIDGQMGTGMDWDSIRQILRQLALCIEHVHQKGIIHGDLKRKISLTLLLISLSSPKEILPCHSSKCPAGWVDAETHRSRLRSELPTRRLCRYQVLFCILSA